MKEIPSHKIDEKENSAIIKLNPSIYNLKVIYSSCYVMLDKAYFILDGEPSKEIIIKISSKESPIKSIVKEFMNELVRSGFYLQQNQETAALRTIMLRRLLMLDSDISLYSDQESREKVGEMLDLVYKSKKQ